MTQTRSRTRRALQWFVINSAMLALIVFGFVNGVQGAVNIVRFLTWLGAISATIFLFDPVSRMKARDLGRSVPIQIDAAYDIVVLSIMVWFGFFLIAILYGYTSLAQYVIFDKPSKGTNTNG